MQVKRYRQAGKRRRSRNVSTDAHGAKHRRVPASTITHASVGSIGGLWSSLPLEKHPCSKRQQDNRGDPQGRTAHFGFLGHERNFNLDAASADTIDSRRYSCRKQALPPVNDRRDSASIPILRAGDDEARPARTRRSKGRAVPGPGRVPTGCDSGGTTRMKQCPRPAWPR